MSGKPENLRRSSRIKALRKYVETDEIENEKTSIRMLNEDIDEEIECIDEDVQKPIELFSDEDVSGQNIYKFQTHLKKDAMIQKANLNRTPVIVNKSKSSKMHEKVGSISPKKGLAKAVVNNANLIKKAGVEWKSRTLRRKMSESESVSEEDEYIPLNDETDSTEEISISGESDSSYDVSYRKAASQSKLSHAPRRSQSRYVTGYSDYHIKADEYFESQSQKSLTSNHTLEQLRDACFTKEKLEELLTKETIISKAHMKSILSLSERCRELFSMWYFIMEEGYSLLLHGLGSKRSIINDFYKEVIIDHPTLIVNGFFPSLTVKDILDGIIVELLDVNSPANISDSLDLIDKTLRKNPKDRLYLLIHNIDGVMLRSNKSQDILSCLANIPNLRILASVDHINAPLMWDNVKHARYNFYWWDATTFLPYQMETSYESSLLVQQSGALALSSLRNVFLSLTSNARSIYILLVKYQLDNGSDNQYPGMPIKNLYRVARENFLVSSDLALRAQLTEFIDHKLVKTKRNLDGAEYLLIPLKKQLLKTFLEENEK